MEFFAGLMSSMPGAVAQGMIWGIMAIGVYITYKILDIADLTVDGSLCTGGAVCVILTINGFPSWFAFTDSNDVTSVTQSACDACEVIYIPTDNTAASNTEAIANVVIPAGVPVIAGEEGICAGCGVATLSISYYDIGYSTGEMAYEILVNGADVSTMEVQYAPNVTKKYNEANCNALGITIPEGYEAIETE